MEGVKMLEQAILFLKRELAGDPLPYQYVLNTAYAAGIKKSDLCRARRLLGVLTKPIVDAANRTVDRLWYLPEGRQP